MYLRELGIYQIASTTWVLPNSAQTEGTITHNKSLKKEKSELQLPQYESCKQYRIDRIDSTF